MNGLDENKDGKINTEKGVKIKDLSEQFKLWFQENHTGSKMPKISDVTAVMIDKYGDPIKNKWSTVHINFASKNDIDDI